MRTMIVFIFRAKTIKNVVVQNKHRSVEELNALVDKLTNQLAALRIHAQNLEKELQKYNPNYTPKVSLSQEFMSIFSKSLSECRRGF